MAQSLSLVLVHLVFSTKNRIPFLQAVIRPEMYAYLAESIRNIQCECFRVGGTEDHVHAAIVMSRTITIADLVEKIKVPSSKWVKGRFADLNAFAWQRGYGCFSVSPKDREALLAYIDSQEQQHTGLSFQDEYRGLMKRYGIEIDERYVWD